MKRRKQGNDDGEEHGKQRASMEEHEESVRKEMNETGLDAGAKRRGLKQLTIMGWSRFGEYVYVLHVHVHVKNKRKGMYAF